MTNLLLGIYHSKTLTCIHKEICARMFTAALFVLANNGKQSKCTSTREWINCDLFA